MKCPWNRSLFLDLEFWEWTLKTLTPSLQENAIYFTTRSYLTLTKILLPNLPYVFIFWFFNRVAEGCRLAEGADMVTKAMGAVSGLGALISKNPLPSFHPRDLLFGAAGAVIIRAVVYFKAKNAKKYRHGVEYGSCLLYTSDAADEY